MELDRRKSMDQSVDREKRDRRLKTATGRMIRTELDGWNPVEIGIERVLGPCLSRHRKEEPE